MRPAQGCGPNRPAASADRRHIGQRQSRVGVGLRQPDRGLHVGPPDALAALQPAPQPFQRCLRRIDARRFAGDRNPVPATGQPHAGEPARCGPCAGLVAEKQRQQRIVTELEGHGLAVGEAAEMAGMAVVWLKRRLSRFDTRMSVPDKRIRELRRQYAGLFLADQSGGPLTWTG